jgi:hypothetical protein
MQNTTWVEMLRLVPADLHDRLLIMTVEGSEIFVTDVVRMEPEYLAVRGRIGGTSDTGLAFFIPYDRIAYVRLQKAIPEELLYGLYGLKPPERKVTEAVEAEEDKQGADTPSGDGATAVPGVSRQELLERLRQRRQHPARTRNAPRAGVPHAETPGGPPGG